MLNLVKSLAVKLETTHKPAKPPTNQPQISQTSYKPAKPPMNHPQTTHKLAKPPTNQPNIGQITHKPASYEQKISFFMLRKTLATLQNMC